jgi:hypothetical protein
MRALLCSSSFFLGDGLGDLSNPPRTVLWKRFTISLPSAARSAF